MLRLKGLKLKMLRGNSILSVSPLNRFKIKSLMSGNDCGCIEFGIPKSGASTLDS